MHHIKAVMYGELKSAEFLIRQKVGFVEARNPNDA